MKQCVVGIQRSMSGPHDGAATSARSGGSIESGHSVRMGPV